MRALSRLLGLALLVVCGAAVAADWPARPLTMVVGFAAGGSDDTLARMLAPRLAELLGQMVVVDNVPGGGGTQAGVRVARAAPDGYEFMLGTTATHALTQALHKKPPYHALNDFTPVLLLAEQPFVLVARKGLPGTRLDDLVAYAKANRKHVQYASEGEGSSAHLVCSLFNAAAGFDAEHIAYAGGAPAMRDLVAERIDYACPVVTTAIAPIAKKEVKPIAVLTRARVPLLPDLASAHEQGLADFSYHTWFALFLPKDVPAAVAARLHEAAAGAISTPFLQARLKQIGADVVSPERRTPQYLQRFVEADIAKWAAALKGAQIKPY